MKPESVKGRVKVHTLGVGGADLEVTETRDPDHR